MDVTESMWFIYVFSEADCDDLCAAGFHLLKSDKCNSIWVFRNDISIDYDLSKIKHVLSGVLTF